MPVGRAEHLGLAVLIRPSHGVILAIALAFRGRQRLGRRPDLINNVQLILRCHPVVRHALQDRVFRGNLLHRVAALVIVPATCDSEKLSPLINLSSTVCVHRAVDHHRRHTGLVHLGDLANVRLIGRVREAFVVHHYIVALGPTRIVVQRDLRPCAAAALVDHLPIHLGLLGHPSDECLGLIFVVMATTAGHEQCPDRFRFFLRLCRRDKKTKCRDKKKTKRITHGHAPSLEPPRPAVNAPSLGQVSNHFTDRELHEDDP